MRLGTLLCMLCLTCALVFSQEAKLQSVTPKASQGSKSAATKRANILELLELTGTKSNISQAMNQMEDTIKPLMERALPPAEYREKLVQQFFEKFRSKFDAQQAIDLAVPE